MAKGPRLEMKSKIVFFGTPDFSVPTLKAIHEHHHLLAIVTQPDRPKGRGQQLQFSPVKQTAHSWNIPIFQPEKASDPLFIEAIQNLGADFFVVIAYGQILKKSLLQVPKIDCINIHASLLPRWRGAAPIQYSLWKGDTKTGVTTMRMLEGLDSGPMYEKMEVEILSEDNSQTLSEKLSKLGANLILSTLQKIRNENLSPLNQDSALVTLSPKIQKEAQWLLPLEQTAEELDCQIRAFFPWPGASIILENPSGISERIKIVRGRIFPDSPPPSKVPLGFLCDWEGKVLLPTKSGILEILKLQPEGKPAMETAAWFNGLKGRGMSFPIRVGSPHVSGT